MKKVPYGYGAFDNPAKKRRKKNPSKKWHDTLSSAAKTHGLGKKERLALKTYYKKRGFSADPEYAETWAKRFADKTEHTYSDSTGQALLEKMYKKRKMGIPGPGEYGDIWRAKRKNPSKKRVRKALIDSYGKPKGTGIMRTIAPKLKKKRTGKKRPVNLNMIAGAVKSPKTPKHLKAGLIKKYGAQLKAKGLMK